MNLLLIILVPVVVGLIANQADALGTWAAVPIARWAARVHYARLPDRAAERAEDWSAQIQESIPGSLFKLAFSLGLAGRALLAATARMRRRPARARRIDPVVRALRALVEEQRVVVYLCDVEGFGYGEIAEIMGMQKRAVRSLLHQGRAHLLSAPAPDGHLGDRLSAFLDGELATAAQERVIAHLAECPACWDLADQVRDVKRRLRAARPESADGPPRGGGQEKTVRLGSVVERLGW